jgi:hypothetical protein
VTGPGLIRVTSDALALTLNARVRACEPCVFSHADGQGSPLAASLLETAVRARSVTPVVWVDRPRSRVFTTG